MKIVPVNCDTTKFVDLKIGDVFMDKDGSVAMKIDGGEHGNEENNAVVLSSEPSLYSYDGCDSVRKLPDEALTLYLRLT